MEDIYKPLNIYMAEEEEEEEESGKETDNESGKDSSSWQDIAGVDAKDFDKPEKLAKSYKDLRTEFSTQGEKIKEFETYRKNADPVLRLIMDNQELREHVEAVAQGKQFDKKDKKDDNSDKHIKSDDQPKGDSEAIQALKSDFVENFESAHGIDKLSGEDKTKTQQMIGSILKEINPSWDKLPILEYRKVMNSAWEIYENRKIKSDLGDKAPSVLGGAVGFGTHSSASKAGSDNYSVESLSAEERKVADKMHISYEDYAKSKKEIHENK